MTEKQNRRLKMISTVGTVVNALGLALGLWLIDKLPYWAVNIVVISILAYAILRLGVGYYEYKWGVLEGSSRPASGGGPSQPFPKLSDYRAEIVFRENGP